MAFVQLVGDRLLALGEQRPERAVRRDAFPSDLIDERALLAVDGVLDLRERSGRDVPLAEADPMSGCARLTIRRCTGLLSART
jgi:hypothetical protein